MSSPSSSHPYGLGSGPPLGRTLMVQGTASSVGKSLLVAGLCRYFHSLGLRVAPFKSQNVALNSFATAEGLEIGRAQAVQAWAAGKAPTVDMNPILLKPSGGAEVQAVIMGEPFFEALPTAKHDRKGVLAGVIEGCLSRLRAENDVVVIEGAGSPVELNLRQRDIANMFVAELADAPVLLVGDIERGGVFAAFLGTLMLLEPAERARVKGLVVNKFRGDLGLFAEGRDLLQTRAGCPVLGVVPYLNDLGIADEDSIGLRERTRSPLTADQALSIAVVMFPYLSNYDDFLPLEREAGVHVRFVGEAEELRTADLVILPGTKNTRIDLQWLRDSGLAQAVIERVRSGKPVLGVCGGYQMLGRHIVDMQGVEGAPGSAEGLGLLPVETRFSATKITRQVRGRPLPSFLTAGQALPIEVSGYEIHMGQVMPLGTHSALFENAHGSEGSVGHGGRCVGTLMHGLFDDDRLRSAMIRGLRMRRGLADDYVVRPYRPAEEFDRLAMALRDSLDLAELHRIVGL